MSDHKQRPQVSVDVHRWWYQSGVAGLTGEAQWAYQPRPDRCYQKDHELGELYSLLTDHQISSVLGQMDEGKTVWARLLLHVCDRHLGATLRMLKDGGINPEWQWEDLAVVGYVQKFHFENPLTAQAVLGWVQEAGAEREDLCDAVRRYHWKEDRQPEFVAAFEAICREARHGYTRLLLEHTLPVNGLRTPRIRI